jgi:PHO85 cyclin-6/7
MVERDHHDGSSVAVPTQPSHDDSHPAARAPDHDAREAPPPSPSMRPAEDNARDDAVRANYAAHANQQRYHPSNNPQNRGYDQAGFPLTSQPSGLAQSSPNSPRLQPTYPSMRSLADSAATSPSRIRVRDLNHIQSFASEEYLARPRLHQRTGSNISDSGRQYEISSMPVTDIIEMVAGLLTKITHTNDRNHDHINRPIPLPEDQANMSPQMTSVLAFHGKNVPSITILSYLSRIHKYCPTTYEVFLSLLVYFDRMTEVVNKNLLMQSQSRQRDAAASEVSLPSMTTGESTASLASHDPAPTSPQSGSPNPHDPSTPTQAPPSPPMEAALAEAGNFFVVDSFNIHRLVIAGVTCASKFFSDVFYTNSRYAKVSAARRKLILTDKS